MKLMRNRIACLTALCLLLAGCSDSSDTYSNIADPNPPLAPISVDDFQVPITPGHVLEGDLSDTSPLVFHQVAVFETDEQRAGDSGGIGFDEAWFDYQDTRQVNFCVEDSGDAGSYLEIFDESGQALLLVDNGQCASLELLPGGYLKRFHLGATSSGLAFLHGQAIADSVSAQGLARSRTVGSAAGLATDGLSTLDVQLRRLLNSTGSGSGVGYTMTASTRSCIRCNLQNISVANMSLDDIDLELARLDGASFSNVSLKSANLSAVSAVGAHFSGSSASIDMSGMTIAGADFSGAQFNNASLVGLQGIFYSGSKQTFVAAPDVTGVSKGEPHNRHDDEPYLAMIGLGSSGVIYEKTWDANKNAGWSGWQALPELPFAAGSAPAIGNDGNISDRQVMYLGQDGYLWRSWRSTHNGWAAWSQVGKPEQVDLVSGPVIAQAQRKGEYSDGKISGFYAAILGVGNSSVEPEVWLLSWYYCDGQWLRSAASNSSCAEYFEPEPDENCRLTTSYPASSDATKVWCNIGSPPGGAASSPALAYKGPFDIVVTTLAADGRFYERGIGKNNSTGMAWKPVTMPEMDGVAVAAAPAASNGGEVGDVLLAYLSETGRLWVGSRANGVAEYSWELSLDAYDAEIIYAPALGNYGYDDRSYLALVTRAPGSTQAGEMSGLNFFFNPATPQGDLAQLGTPGGGGAGAIDKPNFSASAWENVTSDLYLYSSNTQNLSIVDSDISKANFSDADLRGLVLRGNDFTGADLSATSLAGADMSSAVLRDTDLSGVILGAASGVSGCRPGSDSSEDPAFSANPNITCLEGVDFSGAILHGTDFSGTDLRTASFDASPDINLVDPTSAAATDMQSCQAVAQPPAVARTLLRGAQFTPDQFAPELWKSLDLTGATISELQGSVLSSRDYSNALMSNLTLRMVEGDSLDFSHSNFSGSALDELAIVPVSGDAASATNFSHSCFYGASIQGMNLAGAILDGASLVALDASNLVFDRASLAGAVLRGSNFNQASFGNADLRQIDASDTDGPVTFRAANFTNTILYQANLSGAVFEALVDTGQGIDLEAATLNSAFLNDANLSNADFTGANLSDAYIFGGNLKLGGVKFTRANLSTVYMVGVKFDFGTGVQMQGVDLSDAILVNSDLSGLDMSPAQLASGPVPSKLIGAHLEGANLSSTNLGQASLANAVLCGPGQTGTDANTCLNTSVIAPHIDWCDPLANVPEKLCTITAGVFVDQLTDVDAANTTEAVCPDGSRGPCADAQWRFQEAPPPRPTPSWPN